MDVAKEFRAFDEGDWSGWIEQSISGRTGQISRQRDEEAHETLVRVFKGLSEEQRLVFGSALSAVIESTPILQSNAERIFYLLQVAQVVKPRDGRSTIRKLLADGIGNFEIEISGIRRRLQGTLLVAAGKYRVDEWLKDYIWRSSVAYGDFDYALLCMRILSWRLDDSCFKFHQVLIPRFAQHWHVSHYQKQLAPIIRRLGCRYFLQWYQTSFEQLQQLSGSAIELWMVGAEGVLRRASTDPYAKLLLAEWDARQKKMTAREFSETAALHTEADTEVVVETLCRLQPIVEWELVVPDAPAASGLKEPYSLNVLGSSFALDPKSPTAHVLDMAYIRAFERDIGVEDRELDLEYD